MIIAEEFSVFECLIECCDILDYIQSANQPSMSMNDALNEFYLIAQVKTILSLELLHASVTCT